MKIGEFEIDKIYCGDANELIKKIPDKSIDLIYTDPPYLYTTGKRKNENKRLIKEGLNLVNVDSIVVFDFEKRVKELTTSGKSESQARIWASKELNRKEIEHISNGFATTLLDEFCRVMKNIYIYIWCSKWQIQAYLDYFENKNCNFDVLVWIKNNPAPLMHNTMANDIEYCLLFREKGSCLNGDYNTKKHYYISNTNSKDKADFEHPTIKPLEFVKNHIINSSKEGDIILDCFSGSGTTAIACKELKRHYLCFEIDQHYTDIANDRLEGITIQERKNIDAGQKTIFDFLDNE